MTPTLVYNLQTHIIGGISNFWSNICGKSGRGIPVVRDKSEPATANAL